MAVTFICSGYGGSIYPGRTADAGLDILIQTTLAVCGSGSGHWEVTSLISELHSD